MVVAVDQFLTKISNDGEGLRGYNSVIQFHFKDIDETVSVSFEGTSASIIEGVEHPACKIIVSTQNFEKLTNGQLNPQTAFLMGKLKAKGDMSHLLKLSQILSYYA